MSRANRNFPARRVLSTLAFGALLSVMAPAPAGAVPSAATSTCPAAITIGSGGCCVNVVVRDAATNPVSGSVVVIDFGGCNLSFCANQPAGLTVDPVAKTASTLTDVLGVARFCICGVVSPPCTATIIADGVPLCTLPVDSCGGGPAEGDGVSTPTGNQTEPRIATDLAGGAIVAWRDVRPGSGTNDDIYVHHVLPSGAVDQDWPMDGRPLCTAAGTQFNPAITSDGVGAPSGAIVAWDDSRDGNSDIYAQHVLPSGLVDTNWPANGRAVCTAPNGQVRPAIVSDGAGGAIISWSDARSGTGDIYAHHVLASGALDSNWPAQGLPLCTASAAQSFVVSVTDGAGGAIVAWQDSRNGNGDIYAQRVSSAGVAQWTVDGVAVCTAAGGQSSVVSVTDGAGGAIIVWRDARGSDDDIYAQRVSSAGVAQWTLNGVAVCSATLFQQDPSAATDGNGGAIVAWKDNRAGSGAGFTYDIYAQHMTASGTVAPAWPINGRALSTTAGNQELPAVAEDGSGGALVTWQDLRGGSTYDLYAHHVLATGATDGGWPVDGASICGISNHQRLPVIVAGDAGAAIVAWQDRRSGTHEDIYARSIGGSSFFQGAAHFPLGDATLIRDTPDAMRVTDIGGSGADGVRIVLPDGISALRTGFELADESSLPEGAYLEVTSRGRGAAPGESLAVTRMTRLATPGQYGVTSTITGDTQKVVAVYQAGQEVYSDLRSNGSLRDAIIPRGLSANDDLGAAPLSPLLLRWAWEAAGAVLIDNRPGGLPDTTVTGDELRILEADPLPGNYVSLAELVIRGKDLGEIRLLSETSRTVSVPRRLPEGGSLWLASPAPNPAQDGQATFAFRLAKAELVSLEITDVAGRCIDRRPAEAFPAGSHAVRWQPRLRSSGLYFVRLTTGSGESATGRWAVLR